MLSHCPCSLVDWTAHHPSLTYSPLIHIPCLVLSEFEHRRLLLAWLYCQYSLACGGETYSQSDLDKVFWPSVKESRNCLHKLLSLLVGFSLGKITFVSACPDASRRSSESGLPSHWTKSERCMRLRCFRTTSILPRVLSLYPSSIVTLIINWSPWWSGLLWYLALTSSLPPNLW